MASTAAAAPPPPPSRPELKSCHSGERGGQQVAAPGGQAGAISDGGRHLKCDSFKLIDATASGPPARQQNLSEQQRQQQAVAARRLETWNSKTSVLTLTKKPPGAASEPQPLPPGSIPIIGGSSSNSGYNYAAATRPTKTITATSTGTIPSGNNNYNYNCELLLKAPAIEQNNNTIQPAAGAVAMDRKQQAAAESPPARDQAAGGRSNVNGGGGGGDTTSARQKQQQQLEASKMSSYTQQQRQTSTSVASYTSLFDFKKPQQHSLASRPEDKTSPQDKTRLQTSIMDQRRPGLQQFRGPLQRQAAAPVGLQSTSSASIQQQQQPGGRRPGQAAKRSDYDVESASYTNSQVEELDVGSDSEGDDQDEDEDEEEEDEEENDTNEDDEKAPFNSIDKQRLSLAASRLQQQQQSAASNGGKTSRLLADNRQLYCPGSASKLQQQQQQPAGRKHAYRSSSPMLSSGGGGSGGATKTARHTKISFNSNNNNNISKSQSRPPSFDTCQLQRDKVDKRKLATECRKLDLLEQVACLDCDCSHCLKKQHHHKSPPPAVVSTINGGHAIAYHIGKVPDACYHHLDRRYPKTRIAHLILKSIILLLCALLLLLVLFGTIMMSLHLPRAFDQVLNVSRSFNVTIAGRR